MNAHRVRAILLGVNHSSVIVSARRDAGLSQEALAQRLGTTQSAIARLESASSNPRIQTLERALAALGRTLEVRALSPDVDMTQIERHLAMSPAERLRVHDTGARNLQRLRARARRV